MLGGPQTGIQDLKSGGLTRLVWQAAAGRWVLAILSVFAATMATLWLRTVLAPGSAAPFPSALFFCAIIFSSWRGGLGPGILAALLGMLAIKYYFSPPFHSFAVSATEVPRLVMLLGTGIFISWLSDRQKEAEEALQRTRAELEQKVQARTQELREKTHQVEEANLALQRDLAKRQSLAARLQRLNGLYAFSNSVSDVIVRFHDPQELYEKACCIAVEQCGFVMAAVGTVEPGGEWLKAVTHAGREEGYLASIQVSVQPDPLGSGPAGRAYREGRVAYCNDYATDASVRPWRDEALKRGYRSGAAVPLKMAGQPISVLVVYTDQPGFFAAEELRLMETLGENLSFAIESHQTDRGRLRAESALRESNKQLQSLTARLQSLQEEERTRVAREIHDELGQLLTCLKMEFRGMEQDLERINDPRLNPVLDRAVAATELTDALAKSVQHIVAELRPAILDRLGLVEALAHETELFQRAGIACQFQRPEAELRLPDAVATAVFRIGQEAMTNVVRHARASAVEIKLWLEPGEPGFLILEISDNGQGFVAADLSGNDSLGLLGMKERARQFGGEVTLQSRPAEGTVVTLRIPHPQPPATHA